MSALVLMDIMRAAEDLNTTEQEVLLVHLIELIGLNKDNFKAFLPDDLT